MTLRWLAIQAPEEGPERLFLILRLALTAQSLVEEPLLFRLAYILVSIAILDTYRTRRINAIVIVFHLH